MREAEFGNSEIAKRAALAALTTSTGRGPKAILSMAFARSGDAAHAQSLASGLDKQFPSDTMLQKYWLPTIRGSIELARKNPSGALSALQGTSYELGSADLGTGTNLYPLYIRAQAYLGTRQGKEAAAEFWITAALF